MKRPKIPDFVSRPAVDPKGIAYVYCARASSRRRKILWSRMPALDRTADTPCLGSVVPKAVRAQAYAWFEPHGVAPRPPRKH